MGPFFVVNISKKVTIQQLNSSDYLEFAVKRWVNIDKTDKKYYSLFVMDHYILGVVYPRGTKEHRASYIERRSCRCIMA